MLSSMFAARVHTSIARPFVRAAALLAAVLFVGGKSVGAQALNYPALQIPSVSERDYTGAVVGSRGTMMMFQWREGISPLTHFGLDVGLYDPSARGSEVALFFAGTLGYDLMRATNDLPIDFLLTAGLGASISDGRSSVRLPVGVSLGHTFELDQGMAITPFVHPRVSIDICGSCSSRGRSQSDVSLNFDIGASFNINPRLSLRTSVLFSGADQYGGDDAIAVGLTWTPDALRR
jgi:hypothetical protein